MILLNKNKWTNENYKEFLNYLYENKDLKYREFHKKLLNDNIELLGVRTPLLQKIAQQITKGNYNDFISKNKHKYYEEIIIHGLIIGNLKLPFNEIELLLNDFLLYNCNWATNDIVAASLKIFKKHQKEGYIFIKKLINNNNPFNIRFGVVLLLDHYINDEYIDKILEICETVNNENYYVKMAIAWLISICYIKYRNKTIKFLTDSNIDTWIHNKAIQKIIESTRTSKIEKNQIRLLKK